MRRIPVPEWPWRQPPLWRLAWAVFFFFALGALMTWIGNWWT
jgi:hypothetical protein